MLLFLNAIHGFLGNPHGQLHLDLLEARPGMRSSRCPLVACSAIIGPSVTDICDRYFSVAALAPAPHLPLRNMPSDYSPQVRCAGSAQFFIAVSFKMHWNTVNGPCCPSVPP